MVMKLDRVLCFVFSVSFFGFNGLEATCCTVKNEKVRKTAKNVQREPRQRNDIMIHDPKFKTVFLPEMTLKKNPNLINN